MNRPQVITFAPPRLGPDGHYRRITAKWCDKHPPTPRKWWLRPFKRYLRSYEALQGTPQCDCPAVMIHVPNGFNGNFGG